MFSEDLMYIQKVFRSQDPRAHTHGDRPFDNKGYPVLSSVLMGGGNGGERGGGPFEEEGGMNGPR